MGRHLTFAGGVFLAGALIGAAPASGSSPTPDAGRPAVSSTADAGASSAAPKTDGGAPATTPLPAIPTGNLFPYTKKVEKLSNGMTVILVPYGNGGIAAFDLAMRVGSRNEVESGRSGYAHLFEHLMFRGTKKMPEEKYSGRLRQLGVDSNAYTTDDYTLYHNLAPTSALAELIDIEADRFQNLTYTPEVFKTEARAVLGEYNKDISVPDTKAAEVLQKTAFTTHPYKHTTLGFVEDIKNMPNGYDYSKAFFKKYYTPDNAILVIAGDFKQDDLLPLIEKSFGAWKGKGTDPKPKAEPTQPKERTAALEWPTSTLPKLIIGYHTTPDLPSNKDAAVQDLLGSVLLGPTSALYQNLVLSSQMVQDMGSGYDDHRDPDLFVAGLTAKKESDLPAIQAAFDAAIADLSGGKLDPAYLQAVQLHEIYGRLRHLEVPAEVAQAVASQAAITGDPDGFEKKLANLQSVTPDDVTGFAQLYFGAEGRTVLTVKAKGGTP